jgi:hypothetical protein
LPHGILVIDKLDMLIEEVLDIYHKVLLLCLAMR